MDHSDMSKDGYFQYGNDLKRERDEAQMFLAATQTRVTRLSDQNAALAMELAETKALTDSQIADLKRERDEAQKQLATAQNRIAELKRVVAEAKAMIDNQTSLIVKLKDDAQKYLTTSQNHISELERLRGSTGAALGVAEAWQKRAGELESELFTLKTKPAPEPVPMRSLERLEEMLRERLANEIVAYGKTPTDVAVLVQALAELKRMVREG